MIEKLFGLFKKAEVTQNRSNLEVPVVGGEVSIHPRKVPFPKHAVSGFQVNKKTT